MLGLCAAVVFAPSAGHAELFPSDPMIEGAKQCTQYIPREERENGIPMHLLDAIASTESGRFHQGLGLRLPWPWTINAEGQGYFFKTKEEAIAAVKRLQARGIKSIDVGCMQVNLMHHPNAFPSLEQAFDPAYNVPYAATFLHDNFNELKTWKNATAAYHSRTTAYGMPYAGQVFDTWHRILDKVEQAKSGTLSIASTKWDLPKFSRVADVETQLPKRTAVASRTASGRVRTVALSSPRSRMHMRSIKVTSETATRENGVLVIRPQHDADKPARATAVATQMAMDDSPIVADRYSNRAAATKQFSPGSKTVRMNGGSTISVSRGPQFVFDN
jgi:hypothetical protein